MPMVALGCILRQLVRTLTAMLVSTRVLLSVYFLNGRALTRNTEFRLVIENLGCCRSYIWDYLDNKQIKKDVNQSFTIKPHNLCGLIIKDWFTPL